jgi:hypothetical protein
MPPPDGPQLESWIRTQLSAHIGKLIDHASAKYGTIQLDGDTILLGAPEEVEGHRVWYDITVDDLVANIMAGVAAGEITSNGAAQMRVEILAWLANDTIIGPWIAANLP